MIYAWMLFCTGLVLLTLMPIMGVAAVGISVAWMLGLGLVKLTTGGMSLSAAVTQNPYLFIPVGVTSACLVLGIILTVANQ